MHSSTASLPKHLVSIVLFSALMMTSRPVAAPHVANPIVKEPDWGGFDHYDIRIHGRSTLVNLEEAYGSSTVAAMHEAGRKAQAALIPAQESARRVSPGLKFRPSELVGGAEVVRGDQGFLLGSTGGSSTSTALASHDGRSGPGSLHRTWFPTLNSTIFPSPDPVRQLGAYNGRSSAGTWQLVVADGRKGNGTGTLYGWPLVLTPVTYTCGP